MQVYYFSKTVQSKYLFQSDFLLTKIKFVSFFKYMIGTMYIIYVLCILRTYYYYNNTFQFFPILQYSALSYTTAYVLGWVYSYIMYRTQAIYAWLLVVCIIGTENVKRRNLHFTRIVDFLYTIIYTLLHPFTYMSTLVHNGDCAFSFPPLHHYPPPTPGWAAAAHA